MTASFHSNAFPNVTTIVTAKGSRNVFVYIKQVNMKIFNDNVIYTLLWLTDLCCYSVHLRITFPLLVPKFRFKGSFHGNIL